MTVSQGGIEEANLKTSDQFITDYLQPRLPLLFSSFHIIFCLSLKPADSPKKKKETRAGPNGRTLRRALSMTWP